MTKTSLDAIVTSAFNFPASLILNPWPANGSKLLVHSLNFVLMYLSSCFSIELSDCLSSGLLEANLQSPLQLFADFRYHQYAVFSPEPFVNSTASLSVGFCVIMNASLFRLLSAKLM